MECRFPSDFVWGSATAALQIEGAARLDGRGDSVWDRFCREFPERVHERATPEVACDHYHRYREDVEWMSRLAHSGYRFSLSWPRLFPEGTGVRNPAGFDFYDRLLDCLAERQVAPNVTLYHWDLPDTLARAGGWEQRDTVERYLEFAQACFEAFSDRVGLWCTLNEPAWTTLNGYVTALHPPCRSDYPAALQVAHHFLLAHSRCVEQFRSSGCAGAIGIALNLSRVRPATSVPADQQAARRADGILNGWFTEPVLGAGYPPEIWDLYQGCGILPRIEDGDLDCLARAQVDFLGVNYYYPHYASADAPTTDFFLNTSGRVEEDCRFSIAGQFRFVKNPRGRYTDWNWEIDPGALGELLDDVHARRPGLPIYITENGIGLPDECLDGRVADPARIEFVREHLREVAAAIERGVAVRGYYMWSLLDNFSWINGYKKRYGFLFVDRQTLERTPKESAFWFRDVATNHGF